MNENPLYTLKSEKELDKVLNDVFNNPEDYEVNIININSAKIIKNFEEHLTNDIAYPFDNE